MASVLDNPLPKQCRNKSMNKLKRELFLLLSTHMRRSKAKHISLPTRGKI